MLRLVSEIADMETQLGPPGRCDDAVFQHSWCHFVGFIRDLVKAGSVGCVETAVEHVCLFCVDKKAGAQRFIIDTRASNRLLLSPPSRPLLTGEGLCHVELQGALRTTITGLWVSADIKNTFHQMRIPGRLQAFFCTACCPRIRSWLHGNNDRGTTICSLLLGLPYGFSWVMFLCQDVTDHCTLAGSADSPLFCCDQSTPPLLGGEHGMGSLGFRWSYADNFWVRTRGSNCTNVHLARLMARVKKAGLDVHDIFLASRCADVLGYELSRANS